MPSSVGNVAGRETEGVEKQRGSQNKSMLTHIYVLNDKYVVEIISSRRKHQ